MQIKALITLAPFKDNIDNVEMAEDYDEERSTLNQTVDDTIAMK